MFNLYQPTQKAAACRKREQPRLARRLDSPQLGDALCPRQEPGKAAGTWPSHPSAPLSCQDGNQEGSWVFIPLSLASHIAYLPLLWLLLRASFYSTSSHSLSLCCSCSHLYYTQVLLENYKMKLVSVHYDGMQISQPATALPPCPNCILGLEGFTPAT